MRADTRTDTEEFLVRMVTVQMELLRAMLSVQRIKNNQKKIVKEWGNSQVDNELNKKIYVLLLGYHDLKTTARKEKMLHGNIQKTVNFMISWAMSNEQTM